MDAFKMMKKGTFLSPKVPQTSGPKSPPPPPSFLGSTSDPPEQQRGTNPILEQVALSWRSAGNILVHFAGLCLPERSSLEWVIPRPLK